MKKRNVLIICGVLLGIIIDQIIKFLVIGNISLNTDIIIIKNFFSFTNIHNNGAALGILGNNVFMLIIISIVLIWYLYKELKKNDSLINTLSLSLIISGAFGNLIDRLFRGYVIDYISFTLFNNKMPVFNFADILITVGIALFIYIIIKEGKSDKKSK